MSKKIKIENWESTFAAVKRVYDSLPNKMATMAVNIAKENFKKQGFTDTSFEPWRKRKIADKATRKGRAILTNTGRLKRSIRKVAVTKTHAIIGTDVPYAQIHNEGGVINTTETVRSHSRRGHKRTVRGKLQTVKAATVNNFTRRKNLRIVQRQFLGPSYRMNKRLEALVSRELISVFK